MTTRPEDLRREVEKSIAELEKRQVSEEPRAAQIDMNVDPRMLPRTTMDIKVFLASVTQLFKSRFDRSLVLQSVPPGVQPESLSDEALAQFAIANDKLVQFLGGVLSFPDLGRTTPIDKMGFGSQQVSSVVYGTTDEATYVAKQLCLEIWKAAGASRQWSDLQPHVERVRYKSTTRVELGHSLLDLLSPPFRKMIERDISGTDGLGRFMGMVPSDPAVLSEEVGKITVLPHCSEITLVVTTFNNRTGRSEDNLVRIDLEARTDANGSRVRISSELPSDRHTELVNRLVKAMAEK